MVGYSPRGHKESDRTEHARMEYMNGGGLLPKSCPNFVTQWTVAYEISQARILEWVALILIFISLLISDVEHPLPVDHLYVFL